MQFIIPINEAEAKEDGTKGSVTFDVVETNSQCARTNKRKLREYFIARGVKRTEVKKVMRVMFPDGDFGIPYANRVK